MCEIKTIGELAKGSKPTPATDNTSKQEENSSASTVYRIFISLPQCLMSHYRQVAISAILKSKHLPMYLDYKFTNGEFDIPVKDINKSIDNADAVIVIAGLYYGSFVKQTCSVCLLKDGGCKYKNDNNKCKISHAHYAQLLASYKNKTTYLIEHKGIAFNGVDSKTFNKCRTDCHNVCEILKSHGLFDWNCLNSCKSQVKSQIIKKKSLPQFFEWVEGDIHKSFNDATSLRKAVEDGVKYITEDLSKKCVGLVLNSDAFNAETSIGLRRLGIKECTSRLKDTKFSPIACMEKVENRLLFLGVSGSKWIDEKSEKAFCDMLEKLDEANGEVRFLLIDPTCKDFIKMRELRGNGSGGMSIEPYKKWKELINKHSRCLKVRCFNKHLPLFRMQFMDREELAISKYLFQEEQNKTAENGWQNPHLIIGAKKGSDHMFSLLPAFEKYFEEEWEAATDLLDIDLTKL